jgi:hypothetical protein
MYLVMAARLDPELAFSRRPGLLVKKFDFFSFEITYCGKNNVTRDYTFLQQLIKVLFSLRRYQWK